MVGHPPSVEIKPATDPRLEDVNRINVSWDDREATIEMVVAGLEPRWIKYNLMQLENLIALLHEAADYIRCED